MIADGRGGAWQGFGARLDPSRQRYAAMAIVALGVLFRLVFFSTAAWHSGGGEAERVAIALASGHGFADAYYVGSGPTAHLTPTVPLLAGLVFRWFGIHSRAADAILFGWSIGCFAVAALLLDRLFAVLGSRFPERMLALGVMCFLPVFLVHETVVFQYWEGQVTFILMLLGLLHAVGDLAAPPTARRAVVAAVLNGVTIVVNPICGGAATLAQLSAYAERRRWRRLVLHGVLVAAVVVPPVALWAARNQAVLGSPVLLRDNLGMELAFKNNDDVLRAGAGHAVTDAKWMAIHPDGNPAVMRHMRQVGEHAYMMELQRRSFAWIAAHPAGFVWIALQGWVTFFFPPAANFSAGTALPRTLMIWLADAAGLCTLAWAVVRRRPGWLQLALPIAAISAGYAPFVYLWRYHYQSYNLLLFAAACGAGLVLRRWKGVRAGHG